MWKSRRFHLDFKKKLMRGSSPFLNKITTTQWHAVVFPILFTIAYRCSTICVCKLTYPHIYVEEMLNQGVYIQGDPDI